MESKIFGRHRILYINFVNNSILNDHAAYGDLYLEYRTLKKLVLVDHFTRTIVLELELETFLHYAVKHFKQMSHGLQY